MSETQGGSCESCKRKKCKCDRKLPICGQCASSPQLCKYTENNKRGIPGGYLGALETRLNETEIALYNALCELRKLKIESAFTDHPDLSEPLQSRQTDGNKYSRMNEWVRYPLKRSEELETWWNSVDKDKLLEDTREEQPDLNMLFRNEEPLDLPNAGIQYQQQERPLPEAPHCYQSPVAISFGLAGQHTVHDFQENFRPGITAPGELTSDRGVPSSHNTRIQPLGHPDTTYDLSSIQGQVGNWTSASAGGGLNPEGARVVGAKTNRSKELSSRMRYKYY
ncbi:hypothetical protein BGZ57DRAFT_915007 [Hyaloscypha finlandica]|nr:hypothetical protein BGZ57DRAFT_915007 [Hyaloscypha finlandica]